MNSSTVLVVEDDPLLLSGATAMLVEAGVEVVALHTADEALGYLLEAPGAVGVVFTDVFMPGHSDGIHLAELIARHWPHIRVLVTSGRTQPPDLPDQVRFLPKPWSPPQLLDAVREGLAA